MEDIQAHIQAIKPILMFSHSYPLIFATITGSHAFGYASPLSDYDVHGVHLLSLQQVIGFTLPGETVEFKASIGNTTEVDIATHDLKKFLLLLLKGNGNILEVLYSPLVVTTSPLHGELKELGKGCITKMCAAHYKGMAHNQQRRMQANDVKKLLHTYRCLLMGIHLMRTGELEMNVPILAEVYEERQVLDIIEYKLSGMDGLDHGEMNWHFCTIEKLYEQLDRYAEASTLPDKASPVTRCDLEDLLIRVRMAANGSD
jgi:predicted nucleotidyltransferase